MKRIEHHHIMMITCLIIYFLYALFFLIYTCKFKKRMNYQKNPLILEDESTKPFRREDYKKCNWIEFYLTGIILLPIRIILCFIILTIAYIHSLFFSCCFNKYEKSQPNCIFWFYNFFLSCLN